jgi:diguanylate cyclase (GGDEF)-like protein
MRILVVDADYLFARLIKTKLEGWGHTVEIESDGTAAYERIRKEPFRMVILDWDLEGMNGPELCSKIRKLRRPRYTYILFYTTHSDKEMLLAGLEAGADAYLTKPLNTVELRLRIKNGKRLLNLEDELRDGPSGDRTTGIVNRASFDQFFRVILADSIRTGSQGALLYVTVSNYHQIYGQRGFTPAHNMMTDIARLLSEAVRQSDLVARIDEDEFCALLQNTFWDKCLPFATRVLDGLKDLSLYLDDDKIRPNVTISLVNYPQDGMSFETILRTSERIPYQPAS